MNRVLWPDLEPQAINEGWLVDVPPLTSAQVLDALAKRHPMDGYNGMPGRWVFAREVQAATGSYADVQRFDAVAIGLVPSTKYARVVYEVKVSRADWLRERRPIVDAVYPDGGRASRATAKHIARVADEPWAQGFVLAERNKWDAALDVSTEYWVAAPPRCVLVEELPPEAGLIEVRLWGGAQEPRARVIRPAPIRRTPHPDAGFWCAMLRRVAAR